MGKGSSPAPNYEPPKPVTADVQAEPKDMTQQRRGTPLAQREPDPVSAPLLEEQEAKQNGLLA